MNEGFRKRLTRAAKTGRRIAIAAAAGTVAVGSICYTHAAGAGIETIFDEHYYADMYPDLKEAYGYDRAALLEHFMTYGLSEGREMNELIDIVKYREKYQDLQDAFGDDWDAYVAHYLSYGAIEHRDNGTDFDPVDYLNRYGDLQDAFGNDILAAYRHYQEQGRQEGREGRSESVVEAEKASKHSSPAVEEKPSEPETKNFEIQSVEVVSSGRIRVTLNRETEQSLALEAFSIICNSGGSDMTILSVSTNDNMVYDLVTTYYRDQEYDIQITLPDGTAISKVFDYRTDCAQISGINAVRTSAGEARITYNSDEPGYFYYILRENGQALARAASAGEFEATESEIISSGVRTEMRQHENVLTITGLTEGMPYTMYYVAVNTEGKATLVNSLSIDGEVHVENAAAIKGASVFAEKLANGEFLYGFEIELETATSESLTLGQFDISCPLNQTTLGEVRTSDNRIYRVYMQRGTVPKGNNTYTILINLKDGTQLKGSCYLDLQAPNVSARSIEWEDADTVKVTVNSDEAGTLYYAIQDQVEGEGTIVSKDPTQIYANGTKFSMGYGLNYITIRGVKEGQWFCYASEDASGNREDFYSYEQIPEYTAQEPGETSKPKITGVTVLNASNGVKLKVVFNQGVKGLYDNGETQISGVDKKLGFVATYGSEGDLEDNVLMLSVMDPSISLPEGSHTLTIVFCDGTTLTFDFTV
ncbi:hypothetical protein [Acetatifactor muris]|uniref:hypothetical protein n=1 Tax=Acetatifactor muris TaxID=879566 RepID=UPI0023F5513C|nr:hypothetical protein [Acetatifactor muris]